MIIAPLTKADAEAATLVLARAFVDSPVYRAVLTSRTEEARLKTLLRVKGGFVRAFLPNGECRVARDTDGKVVGVTLSAAPGHYPLSPWAEIVQSTGCATTGPVAIARFLRLTAYMRRLHHKGPHYYLFAIGVDPAHQGRGIGRKLLAELHVRADAQRVPSYLETEKPINVKLYESVGYRVSTEETIPGLGVPMWTMLRPAGG